MDQNGSGIPKESAEERRKKRLKRRRFRRSRRQRHSKRRHWQAWADAKKRRRLRGRKKTRVTFLKTGAWESKYSVFVCEDGDAPAADSARPPAGEPSFPGKANRKTAEAQLALVGSGLENQGLFEDADAPTRLGESWRELDPVQDDLTSQTLQHPRRGMGLVDDSVQVFDGETSQTLQHPHQGVDLDPFQHQEGPDAPAGPTPEEEDYSLTPTEAASPAPHPTGMCAATLTLDSASDEGLGEADGTCGASDVGTPSSSPAGLGVACLSPTPSYERLPNSAAYLEAMGCAPPPPTSKDQPCSGMPMKSDSEGGGAGSQCGGRIAADRKALGSLGSPAGPAPADGGHHVAREGATAEPSFPLSSGSFPYELSSSTGVIAPSEGMDPPGQSLGTPASQKAAVCYTKAGGVEATAQAAGGGRLSSSSPGDKGGGGRVARSGAEAAPRGKKQRRKKNPAATGISLLSLVERAFEQKSQVSDEKLKRMRRKVMGDNLTAWGKVVDGVGRIRIDIDNKGECSTLSLAEVFFFDQGCHLDIRKAVVGYRFLHRRQFLNSFATRDGTPISAGLIFEVLQAHEILPSNFLATIPPDVPPQYEAAYTLLSYLKMCLTPRKWLGYQELMAMQSITGIPILLFTESHREPQCIIGVDKEGAQFEVNEVALKPHVSLAYYDSERHYEAVLRENEMHTLAQPVDKSVLNEYVAAANVLESCTLEDFCPPCFFDCCSNVGEAAEVASLDTQEGPPTPSRGGADEIDGATTHTAGVDEDAAARTTGEGRRDHAAAAGEGQEGGGRRGPGADGGEGHEGEGSRDPAAATWEGQEGGGCPGPGASGGEGHEGGGPRGPGAVGGKSHEASASNDSAGGAASDTLAPLHAQIIFGNFGDDVRDATGRASDATAEDVAVTRAGTGEGEAPSFADVAEGGRPGASVCATAHTLASAIPGPPVGVAEDVTARAAGFGDSPGGVLGQQHEMDQGDQGIVVNLAATDVDGPVAGGGGAATYPTCAVQGGTAGAAFANGGRLFVHGATAGTLATCLAASAATAEEAQPGATAGGAHQLASKDKGIGFRLAGTCVNGPSTFGGATAPATPTAQDGSNASTTAANAVSRAAGQSIGGQGSAGEPSDAYQILVMCPFTTGIDQRRPRPFCVEVRPFMTIQDLVEHVVAEKMPGADPADYRFVCGSTLDAQGTLSSCGITPEASLWLLPRLRGGGANKPTNQAAPKEEDMKTFGTREEKAAKEGNTVHFSSAIEGSTPCIQIVSLEDQQECTDADSNSSKIASVAAWQACAPPFQEGSALKKALQERGKEEIFFPSKSHLDGFKHKGRWVNHKTSTKIKGLSYIRCACKMKKKSERCDRKALTYTFSDGSSTLVQGTGLSCPCPVLQKQTGHRSRPKLSLEAEKTIQECISQSYLHSAALGTGTVEVDDILSQLTLAAGDPFPSSLSDTKKKEFLKRRMKKHKTSLSKQRGEDKESKSLKQGATSKDCGAVDDCTSPTQRTTPSPPSSSGCSNMEEGMSLAPQRTTPSPPPTSGCSNMEEGMSPTPQRTTPSPPPTSGAGADGWESSPAQQTTPSSIPNSGGGGKSEGGGNLRDDHVPMFRSAAKAPDIEQTFDPFAEVSENHGKAGPEVLDGKDKGSVGIKEGELGGNGGASNGVLGGSGVGGQCREVQPPHIARGHRFTRKNPRASDLGRVKKKPGPGQMSGKKGCSNMEEGTSPTQQTTPSSPPTSEPDFGDGGPVELHTENNARSWVSDEPLWECHLCTFLSEARFLKCKSCGLARINEQKLNKTSTSFHVVGQESKTECGSSIFIEDSPTQCNGPLHPVPEGVPAVYWNGIQQVYIEKPISSSVVKCYACKKNAGLAKISYDPECSHFFCKECLMGKRFYGTETNSAPTTVYRCISCQNIERRRMSLTDRNPLRGMISISILKGLVTEGLLPPADVGAMVKTQLQSTLFLEWGEKQDHKEVTDVLDELKGGVESIHAFADCNQGSITDPLGRKDLSTLWQKCFLGRLDEFVGPDGLRNKIRRSHLRALLPRQWLNDDVITSWFELLQEANPQNQYFGSLFFEKLYNSQTGKYNYDNVKSFTRKSIRRTRSIDVFKKEKIFFAVNVRNNHFFLCVMDMKQSKLLELDSFGEKHKTECLVLLRWLKDEYWERHTKTLNTKQWVIEAVVQAPRQINMYDCGVYTSMYAAYITYDLKMRFSDTEMPTFRKKMALAIATGSLGQFFKKKSTHARPQSSNSFLVDIPRDCSITADQGKPDHGGNNDHDDSDIRFCTCFACGDMFYDDEIMKDHMKSCDQFQAWTLSQQSIPTPADNSVASSAPKASHIEQGQSSMNNALQIEEVEQTSDGNGFCAEKGCRERGVYYQLLLGQGLDGPPLFCSLHKPDHPDIIDINLTPPCLTHQGDRNHSQLNEAEAKLQPRERKTQVCPVKVLEEALNCVMTLAEPIITLIARRRLKRGAPEVHRLLAKLVRIDQYIDNVQDPWGRQCLTQQLKGTWKSIDSLLSQGEAVMTTKGLEREQKLKMRREAADAIGFDLNLPQPTEALSIFKGKSGQNGSMLNDRHLEVLNAMQAHAQMVWENRDDSEADIYDSNHAAYWFVYDCERLYYTDLPASSFKAAVLGWVEEFTFKIEKYRKFVVIGEPLPDGTDVDISSSCDTSKEGGDSTFTGLPSSLFARKVLNLTRARKAKATKDNTSSSGTALPTYETRIGSNTLTAAPPAELALLDAINSFQVDPQITGRMDLYKQAVESALRCKSYSLFKDTSRAIDGARQSLLCVVSDDDKPYYMEKVFQGDNKDLVLHERDLQQKEQEREDNEKQILQLRQRMSQEGTSNRYVYRPESRPKHQGFLDDPMGSVALETGLNVQVGMSYAVRGRNLRLVDTWQDGETTLPPDPEGSSEDTPSNAQAPLFASEGDDRGSTTSTSSGEFDVDDCRYDMDSLNTKIKNSKISTFSTTWELGGVWRSRMDTPYFMIARTERMFIEGKILDTPLPDTVNKPTRLEMVQHFLDVLHKVDPSRNFSFVGLESGARKNIKQTCLVDAKCLITVIEQAGIVETRLVVHGLKFRGHFLKDMSRRIQNAILDDPFNFVDIGMEYEHPSDYFLAIPEWFDGENSSGSAVKIDVFPLWSKLQSPRHRLGQLFGTIKGTMTEHSCFNSMIHHFKYYSSVIANLKAESCTNWNNNPAKGEDARRKANYLRSALVNIEHLHDTNEKTATKERLEIRFYINPGKSLIDILTLCQEKNLLAKDLSGFVALSEGSIVDFHKTSFSLRETTRHSLKVIDCCLTQGAFEPWGHPLDADGRGSYVVMCNEAGINYGTSLFRDLSGIDQSTSFLSLQADGTLLYDMMTPATFQPGAITIQDRNQAAALVAPAVQRQFYAESARQREQQRRPILPPAAPPIDALVLEQMMTNIAFYRRNGNDSPVFKWGFYLWTTSNAGKKNVKMCDKVYTEADIILKVDKRGAYHHYSMARDILARYHSSEHPWFKQIKLVPTDIHHECRRVARRHRSIAHSEGASFNELSKDNCKMYWTMVFRERYPQFDYGAIPDCENRVVQDVPKEMLNIGDIVVVYPKSNTDQPFRVGKIVDLLVNDQDRLEVCWYAIGAHASNWFGPYSKIKSVEQIKTTCVAYCSKALVNKGQHLSHNLQQQIKSNRHIEIRAQPSSELKSSESSVEECNETEQEEQVTEGEEPPIEQQRRANIQRNEMMLLELNEGNASFSSSLINEQPQAKKCRNSTSRADKNPKQLKGSSKTKSTAVSSRSKRARRPPSILSTREVSSRSKRARRPPSILSTREEQLQRELTQTLENLSSLQTLISAPSSSCFEDFQMWFNNLELRSFRQEFENYVGWWKVTMKKCNKAGSEEHILENKDCFLEGKRYCFFEAESSYSQEVYTYVYTPTALAKKMDLYVKELHRELFQMSSPRERPINLRNAAHPVSTVVKKAVKKRNPEYSPSPIPRADGNLLSRFDQAIDFQGSGDHQEKVRHPLTQDEGNRSVLSHFDESNKENLPPNQQNRERHLVHKGTGLPQKQGENRRRSVTFDCGGSDLSDFESPLPKRQRSQGHHLSEDNAPQPGDRLHLFDVEIDQYNDPYVLGISPV